MALNIRNPETEKLADALVKLTGETKTEAVIQALRDRLERIRRERSWRRLADELNAVAAQCAALPMLDTRDADLRKHLPNPKIQRRSIFPLSNG